jgi:hypothetical protein
MADNIKTFFVCADETCKGEKILFWDKEKQSPPSVPSCPACHGDMTLDRQEHY